MTAVRLNCRKRRMIAVEIIVGPERRAAADVKVFRSIDLNEVVLWSGVSQVHH